MSKDVAAKTWELSVYNGRRYSAGPPIVVNGWPLHEPAYLSVLPGVAGPGMDTPAGTGRHLETPATSVYFINSLDNANTGAAVSGLGPNVYAGTLEWCRRATASPKVIIPLVSGWAVLQKSLPLQTGTPPRPGYVTEAYHFAPHPGLWLRGAKVSLNGASNVAVWHLRSYMGDDETGISVANRDPMGSGYSGGVVTNIAAINCELAWSCDELLDMYYSHDGVSLVNCAFINPLHETSLNPSEDHGFGPMMGGGSQFGVAASFRCLWSNITDRAPFTNSVAHTHANNLHWNSGRPGGGAGYALRIVNQAATEAVLVNALANGFVRGPENNNNIVAVATTATLPAGSQGYLEDNAVHGWTASTQAALLSTSISGFAQSTLIEDAYPPEWGEDGVLRWSAQAPMPTEQEWDGYVSLMEATVGAQPGWRMPQFGKVSSVFQAVKDTLAGNMPGPQFSDSVADEGGWFDVPEVGPIDPTNPGAHWWAAFPTSGRDDVLDGSATWGNEPWIPEPFRGTGLQLAGRTVLERWIIKQHWYVMDPSTRPPLPPPESDEVIGPASNIDVYDQQVYRLDDDDTMPSWEIEGATVTAIPGAGWDGGTIHRITPVVTGVSPNTGQGNAGLGQFHMPNDLPIRKLNMRWEQRFGPDWITQLNSMTKWVILFAGDTPSSAPNGERPMLYLSDMNTQAGDAPSALQRNDLMAAGVAAGTLKNFEPIPPYTGYNWPRGNEDFYFGPTATTIAGKRIVPQGEWYTFEMETISEATDEYPNGLIRLVVWNRAGEQLTDLKIPWNYDSNWSVGDYMIGVDVVGGGYMNAVPSPTADNYTDVAAVTFSANRPGLIGPRAGFVE